LRLVSIEPAPIAPPEADKVLAAQESLGNFGILIPAYLPKRFNRADVDIKVSQNGPSGEPSVDMVYKTKKNQAIFVRQWVPANPDMETLYGSRPIETKWGKSYLLTQTKALIALWVDVGPLRISVSTRNLEVVSREQLVLIAETLGLASNLQVYSFVTKLPEIKNVAPPPPFEVKTNGEGIQELNLVITPGGYSPMRFAVRKDVPVKLNFRALGEVGCGNVLVFPADPANPAALTLSQEQLVQTIKFTPSDAGDFPFQCTINCFRGIMTVRE